MKKTRRIFSALALALLLAGCGTKSSYRSPPGLEALNPSGGFSIGQVYDRSGYEFPDLANAFNLEETMASALWTALARQGLAAENGQYTIDVNILAYVPGNAFARWLLPGAGATKLEVEAVVFDRNYFQVARIPVYRHIGAGGALTVGAHKSAFGDVADRIVSILKDPAKQVDGKSSLTLVF